MTSRARCTEYLRVGFCNSNVRFRGSNALLELGIIRECSVFAVDYLALESSYVEDKRPFIELVKSLVTKSPLIFHILGRSNGGRRGNRINKLKVWSPRDCT